MWSSTGSELFYSEPGNRKMYVVTYSTHDNSFAASQPRVWSDKDVVLQQAPFLMPDGKHFTAIVAPSELKTDRHADVMFLLNFADELRRRLPAGK